jgi:phosphocarrier protein HPr
VDHRRAGEFPEPRTPNPNRRMSDSRQATVTIKNRLGLHARPAMALVDLANRYESKVTLRRSDSDELIDGKSIMQVMMLAAGQGTQIHIQASGPDADQAVQAIVEMVDREFDE